MAFQIRSDAFDTVLYLLVPSLIGFLHFLHH